jgi:hypothetical protein
MSDEAAAFDERNETVSSYETPSEPMPGARCPLPMAHDRFDEAHWFLHQMIEHYHEPALFRYSTNAFLSALKAVVEMLGKELERVGKSTWMTERTKELRDDQLISACLRGRDIVLHQKSLISGSRIEAGLFRGQQLKLAHRLNVRHDATSASILEFLQSRWIGSILDEGHSAIGEQLGVRRMYHVAQLSESDDVLSAAHRAWARMSILLSDAHTLCEAGLNPVPESDVAEHDVLRVNLLLETDVDPEGPVRWGWVGSGDED